MMITPFADLTANHAADIATRFGTPAFLVDERALRSRYRALDVAANRHCPGLRLAYSYKTNPTRAVLEILHEEGAWAEVVSGDEYQLTRHLGIPGRAIVFNGPAKSDDDLRLALTDGAHINADHFDEIRRGARIARDLGKVADIGIRVVVDDGAGLAWDRFGFPIADGSAVEAAALVNSSGSLRLAGLHAHIGTNIRNLARFSHLGKAISDLAAVLRQSGIALKWIDLGGGLAGISPRWDEERAEPWPPPDAQAYAAALLPGLTEAAPLVLLELGRTLVEPAGGLLTRVIGSRQGHNGSAYVVDAGIAVVPTAKVYRHPIRPLTANGSATPVETVLLGPSCMQHDRLAERAMLPPLSPGDLLLMSGVGAYNMSRGSSFIHFQPAAVLWREGETVLIRRHETLADNQSRELPLRGAV